MSNQRENLYKIAKKEGFDGVKTPGETSDNACKVAKLESYAKKKKQLLQNIQELCRVKESEVREQIINEYRLAIFERFNEYPNYQKLLKNPDDDSVWKKDRRSVYHVEFGDLIVHHLAPKMVHISVPIEDIEFDVSDFADKRVVSARAIIIDEQKYLQLSYKWHFDEITKVMNMIMNMIMQECIDKLKLRVEYKMSNNPIDDGYCSMVRITLK